MNIEQIIKRYFTMELEIHQKLYGYVDIPAFQRAEQVVKEMKPIIKYFYKRNKRGLRCFN